MYAMSRFKPNNRGFYLLRRDPGLIKDVEERAERVARACNAEAATNGRAGAKYATSSRQGAKKPQGRWRTTVITANYEAMIDNHKNNTLEKCVNREGR